jgi:Uncharacterized protein conserved in bacteria
MSFLNKLLDLIHSNSRKPQTVSDTDAQLSLPEDGLDMEADNSLTISFVKDICSVFDSKIGGMPYLPKESAYPMDHRDGRTDKPLAFLCQINLETMPPLEHFPNIGMLQFYIGTDTLYGLDLKHPTLQNGFRVIYYPSLLPMDDLQMSLPIEVEFDGEPPYQNELRMEFTPAVSVIGWQDFRYDDYLLKAYQKQNPFTTSVDDIPDDLRDRMEALCDASGSRISGFPLFTQADPRQTDTSSGEYTSLLIQLDTDTQNGVRWGDDGVCQFFICPKDLEHRDFSHVLYNWDCY